MHSEPQSIRSCGCCSVLVLFAVVACQASALQRLLSGNHLLDDRISKPDAQISLLAHANVALLHLVHLRGLVSRFHQPLHTLPASCAVGTGSLLRQGRTQPRDRAEGQADHEEGRGRDRRRTRRLSALAVQRQIARHPMRYHTLPIRGYNPVRRSPTPESDSGSRRGM